MFESLLKRVSKRDSKSAKSKKSTIDKNNSAPMELSSFRPLRSIQAHQSINTMEPHVYDEINDNAYVYVFETNEISSQNSSSLSFKKSPLDSSEDSSASSSSECSSLSTRGTSKRVHFSQIVKHTFDKKHLDFKHRNIDSQFRSTNSILKKSSAVTCSTCPSASSSSSCSSSRLSSSSIPSTSNSLSSNNNNFDELVEHFVTRLMCKTNGNHNCNICNKYLTMSESSSNSYSVCVNQSNVKNTITISSDKASESVNKLSCRVSNLTLDDLKMRKKLMDSA